MKLYTNTIFIRLIAAGTVTIDATVLRNSTLLAGPGSSPSCSASIETVAAVGKHAPSTSIDFISDDNGRKYTSTPVSAGSHTSFIRLDSITVRLLMMSLNL